MSIKWTFFSMCIYFFVISCNKDGYSINSNTLDQRQAKVLRDLNSINLLVKNHGITTSNYYSQNLNKSISLAKKEFNSHLLYNSKFLSSSNDPVDTLSGDPEVTSSINIYKKILIGGSDASGFAKGYKYGGYVGSILGGLFTIQSGGWGTIPGYTYGKSIGGILVGAISSYIAYKAETAGGLIEIPVPLPVNDRDTSYLDFNSDSLAGDQHNVLLSYLIKENIDLDVPIEYGKTPSESILGNINLTKNEKILFDSLYYSGTFQYMDGYLIPNNYYEQQSYSSDNQLLDSSISILKTGMSSLNTINDVYILQDSYINYVNSSLDLTNEEKHALKSGFILSKYSISYWNNF